MRFIVKNEPKAYLWLNHNLFAESYAAIDRLLPDHPFKNRFEAARDSIFRLNQDKYDALDAKLPEMLDNYFKTDYFSRHGQRIDSLDDPELNHKLDSLDLYEITFQYELLLPGKILSSTPGKPPQVNCPGNSMPIVSCRKITS